MIAAVAAATNSARMSFLMGGVPFLRRVCSSNPQGPERLNAFRPIADDASKVEALWTHRHDTKWSSRRTRLIQALNIAYSNPGDCSHASRPVGSPRRGPSGKGAGDAAWTSHSC